MGHGVFVASSALPGVHFHAPHQFGGWSRTTMATRLRNEFFRPEQVYLWAVGWMKVCSASARNFLGKDFCGRCCVSWLALPGCCYSRNSSFVFVTVLNLCTLPLRKSQLFQPRNHWLESSSRTTTTGTERRRRKTLAELQFQSATAQTCKRSKVFPGCKLPA